MNNLIKHLKTNDRAFGLCSKEERECFQAIKLQNCMFFDSTGSWYGEWGHTVFQEDVTYRIKADYQAETEYVEEERIFTVLKTKNEVALAVEIQRLQDENEKLKALSIFEWTDGCYCENCTVERMYGKIKQLQADNDRQREALEACFEWNECLPESDSIIWHFDKELITKIEQALERR